MKKRVLTLAVLIGAFSIFASGCGFKTNMTINSDLTSKTTSEIYYTPAEIKELGMTKADVKEAGMKEVKVDGKTYYQMKDSETSDAATTKENFTLLTSSKMEAFLGSKKDYQELADEEDLSDLESAYDFFSYSITFPKKVLKTNGKIADDGKTVSFDLATLTSGKRLYAAMSDAAVNSKTIEVTGVTNKKIYNTTKKVKVKSPGVITSFKVNGKEQELNSFTASKSKKYTVKVKLLSGAAKTVSFTVDKVKPTVNVKAKTYSKAITIKFSDKLTGIKKATLNGKKIKSGKKVSKNGSYTLKVTDKAGNTQTVKFKIKK